MQEQFLSILFAASVILSVVYYALLQRFVPASGKELSLKNFLPFWLALFTFEYFFLGPFSYISMDVDGNLTIVIDYYLANFHEGGKFSHLFGGGQDMYVWFLGMQYFQPEKLLFYLLPTWLVILLHKLMVGALGFIGTYLLAKRTAPENHIFALALATVYPISHVYLTEYSLSFGTGFAVLPLTIYWCLGCTDSKRYWWLVAASALILAAGDPIKVFPALLVAYVGGIILIKNVNVTRAGAAFAVVVLVAVLNWHEVLFGHMLAAPFVSRGLVGLAGEPLSFLGSTKSTLAAMASYRLVAGLLTISLAVLIWRKDRFVINALAAVFWLFASIVLASSFPWDLVGLSFLNRLSHQQYMVLALGTITIPVAAHAFSGAKGGVTPMLWRLKFHPALVLMAIALGVLTWNKGYNVAHLIYSGGQAVYKGIYGLANPDWNPKPRYRTVTFYEIPHSNVVAGYYGFEAFDGQLNLNNKLWSAYWAALLHGNKQHVLTTRLGWFWDLWNGESYTVERHVRLDLLAIANVRYLFSPLPLKSAVLKLLHAPPRDEWTRVRPDFFDGSIPFLRHRLKRVFDAGDVFVYELPTALPRAFAVTNVVSVPESQDETVFFNSVAGNAINGAAVAWSSVATRLGDAQPIKVLEVTEVRDGYDISVSSPNGGILALNQTPFPFWRAYDQDGRPLSPEPVNGVHMAVKLPPGTSEVRFRYERPLLRELLFRKFQ